MDENYTQFKEKEKRTRKLSNQSIRQSLPVLLEEADDGEGTVAQLPERPATAGQAQLVGAKRAERGVVRVRVRRSRLHPLSQVRVVPDGEGRERVVQLLHGVVAAIDGVVQGLLDPSLQGRVAQLLCCSRWPPGSRSG